MYTRKDYLDGKCTHRQYYAQFVNTEVKRLVRRRWTVERLQKYFAEPERHKIPLYKWDALGLPLSAVHALEQAGDYYTLAGQVCILKEAARQIVEESTLEPLEVSHV
jgi:hypothetical protein